MATYQGPVRPNESESKYRETGKTEREKKEDLYVNIDDISKPDAKVMTREETGLDKPTTYTGGGSRSGRDKSTQVTEQVIEQPKPEVKLDRYQQERENYRKRQQALLESKQRYDTKVETLKNFRNTSEYQKYKQQFKGNYSDVDVYNKYVSDINKQQLAEREKLGTGYSTKEGYVYVKPIEKVENKNKEILKTATLPKKGERNIQIAGVRLPTATQAYNFLFTGADYGTPESYQKVTPTRALVEVPEAFFVKAPYLIGQTSTGVLASSLGAGGKTSETISKVGGYGAVAATFYYGTSAKVIGKVASEVVGGVFGAASTYSGGKKIFSTETTPTQKAIGVGEVALGGLMGAGAVARGGETVVKVVEPTKRVISYAAEKGAKVYNIIEPVKATEFGYIGGQRVIRPALEKGATMIKQGTINVVRKTQDILRPYETQIVIGQPIKDVAVKTISIVKPIAKEATGSIIRMAREVAEPVKAVGRGFKESIEEQFRSRNIPVQDRTYGVIGKPQGKIVGEFVSQNYKNMFLTPSQQTKLGYEIAKQNILRPISNIKKEVAFKLGDIKYGVIRQVRSLSSTAGQFGRDVIEPVKVLGRGIYTTFTSGGLRAEQTISKQLSQRERIKYFMATLAPISRTPTQEVKIGYEIVKGGLATPFRKYKEAVLAASERVKYQDYLLKGGAPDLLERPAFSLISKESPTLTIIKEVKPLTVEVPTGRSIQVLEQPTTIAPEIVKPVSEYAGKGLYERTAFTSTLLNQPTQNVPSQLEMPSGNLVFAKTQPELLSAKEKIDVGVKTTQTQKNRSIQLSRNAQDIINANALTTGQASISAQAESTATRSRQRFRQEFKQKEKAKRIIPLFLPKTMGGETPISPLSKLKKAYSVIIKRRGKEVEIGKALPLGKAKKLGITSVLGSLARSYKLKEAGTTVEEDIYYSEPIGVFRPSKVGAFRVQKSKFALSSSAERREIQMFKRQKSRRSNWL